MSFFQNPFNTDFYGVLVLGDRQASVTFKIAGNRNSSIRMLGWNLPPYNLSGNTNLTINFCNAPDPAGVFRNYTAITVNVSSLAQNAAAATSDEVVAALNASAAFTARFSASVNIATNGTRQVLITANSPAEDFRAYITNGSAESIIRFNANAGVAELPTYFARHTVANANAYTDSNATLIQLNTGVSTDQAIITAAGLVYGNMQADWQLLRGRSGIFNFQKITVDGSNRITEIIEYPAGAVAGDFARQINYVYSGSNTNPSQIAELPYTLTGGDLISP